VEGRVVRITNNNERPSAEVLFVGAGSAGLTTDAWAARDAAKVVLVERAPVWAVLRPSRITSGQRRRSTGRRPVNPTGRLVGDGMTYRDWIVSADADRFEPANTFEACRRRRGSCAGANDVRQGSQRGGASRQSVSTGGTWHAYRKH
jgi:hypothetical protein